MSLPPPGLDFDFRMQVTLNPNVASVAMPGPGQQRKNTATFARGSWAGIMGAGLVVVCLPRRAHEQTISSTLTLSQGGGLESQDFFGYGDVWGTKVEAIYQLVTNEEPPAQYDALFS